MSDPFPEIKSTKSLVAKYVTEPVWNKLSKVVTETSGFTLAQAIACAVEFDNQHCGIYAGDWDSYKVFAEVFDPIIQDYHGISADSTHTSDMDAEKIVGNIETDVPVKSTRIRVGRSIEGFGLSPGITKEQRLEVEKLMKTAFGKLEGDLSGDYYPLLGMEEDVRQKLVDDHFLFMSGDKNLISAGMERDWPEGRGIFHNDAKTFLIWVNEEDQLRIISMEKGGDVKGVFERLARGIKAVGDSVKKESGKDFCLDAKYGYIHSCPTNLGTGMRASVHVDLPGWTKYSVDKLKERCEELHLQPRGTRGESGGQTGHTYDISNKHRLGYSEVELVQKMIDGVNKLWEEDKKLQAGGTVEMYRAMPAQTNGPFPNIQSKHSLVASHVSKPVWEQLKGIKTKTSGFTLIQAIACAVEFDNQHCGIYAGDWDSYKDFAPVFDPIIQEYHGISSDSRHTSDMDSSKIKGNIASDVPVHSARIRVGRSIDGFGLSPGITKEQRLGVEKLMKSATSTFTGDLAGQYYPLTGMDEKVRQQLVDDHFLFVSGDRNLTVAGMERDWPEGRGIFHNAAKTFLIWINEEDQLRIISTLLHGDDSELILLVDPDEEGLGSIVEDASALWPVSLHTSNSQISVSRHKEEVIINKLLSDLLVHSSQGIVLSSKVSSEGSSGTLHQFLNTQTLLLCNSRRQTKSINRTSNTNPSRVNRNISSNISLDLGGIHVRGVLGVSRDSVVLLNDGIKDRSKVLVGVPVSSIDSTMLVVELNSTGNGLNESEARGLGLDSLQLLPDRLGNMRGNQRMFGLNVGEWSIGLSWHSSVHFNSSPSLQFLVLLPELVDSINHFL